MINLQKKISTLMAEKNLSAADIERKTGLNRNTVYSILAGNSKNPSAHNLQLIAKSLDVSLESILIDEEEIKIGTLTFEQMKVFDTATNSTVNLAIKKEVNLSLSDLLSIIKEVYQYTLKADLPKVDDRFVDWLIDKHHKS